MHLSVRKFVNSFPGLRVSDSCERDAKSVEISSKKFPCIRERQRFQAAARIHVCVAALVGRNHEAYSPGDVDIEQVHLWDHGESEV